MSDGSPKTSQTVLMRAGIAIAVFVVLIGAVFASSPENLYLWIKAFHVISIIAWMAGLLYLPRLFIYHLDTKPESPAAELFKVMEKRLYRIIMNPAMMISWVLGLYLAWSGFGFSGGWLHAKLLAVGGLTAAHIYMGQAVRKFGAGTPTLNARSWRLINEVPTVLMILIVILVIVKPF